MAFASESLGIARQMTTRRFAKNGSASQASVSALASADSSVSTLSGRVASSTVSSRAETALSFTYSSTPCSRYALERRFSLIKLKNALRSILEL